MAQSKGTLQTTGLALSLAREVPADPHAAAMTRAKAAASVAEFVRGSAQKALNAVLDAAEHGKPMARDTLRDTIERTRLLDAEVRRFRSLDARK